MTEEKTRTQMADECVKRMLAGDEFWSSELSTMRIDEAISIAGLAIGMLVKMAGDLVSKNE